MVGVEFRETGNRADKGSHGCDAPFGERRKPLEDYTIRLTRYRMPAFATVRDGEKWRGSWWPAPDRLALSRRARAWRISLHRRSAQLEIELSKDDNTGYFAPATDKQQVGRMKIGVPKETLDGETRVALTPDVVRKLCAKGLDVSVESGAGDEAHFPNPAFKDAGAAIVTREEAFACDVVVKVRRPDRAETALIAEKSVLVSFIELCEDDGTLGDLSAKGITVIALERIPRISRAQSMDALSSQSNIAGYRAVIEAAARFGRFFPVMMTAAGSVKPARVIVLGAGVAGLQAIATARRLGADVHAYDIRPEVADEIRSLGAKVIELEVAESGSGEGGYARELSAEAKKRQQEALSIVLGKADVIISTAMIPCRPAPVLITEDALGRLRPGSVVVDLAAATGGNCVFTQKDKVIKRCGVTIVGLTNFPAMMPADASSFYARNVFNLLQLMIEEQDGGLKFSDFTKDEITAEAMVRL